MAPGSIVASKYLLLQELGRGGMGSVWAASHIALRTQVAVKLIDARLANSEDARRRFEREARAAAALRSPHVVQVLDFGVDAGRPYLVMELLKGSSLSSRLARDGVLSADDVHTVMSHIGRAMTRAHNQGFVHRDLKPDNIFLVDDDAELLVKVLDFGIAKALHSTQSGAITGTGVLLGTPNHMSPEQAEGRSIDARSDLFSMGVVAFECLTGKQPFHGASLPALLSAICFEPIVVPSSVARVPPGFDAWFARAVARDRERRFQTAREMVEALAPLLRQPRSCWVGPSGSARPSEPAGIEATYVLPGGTAPRARHHRAEERVPSSIPAGIDGQRDLEHLALVQNASRSGALLMTRRPCKPAAPLCLTLQLAANHPGTELRAHVVRVAPHNDSIWKFEVGIEFDFPLADSVLGEIERRAKRP